MIPGRGPVLLLAVAAAGTAAYLGTLGHGFVYDDHRFVDGNPHLAEVAAAPWRAFDPGTTSAEGAEPGMWRPLRTLSFALDRAIFGDGAAGPHLANALLHGIAAGLVMAVGLAAGLDDLAAAAGAAVFALHPVQTEAVAWISSRGDLLASVLALGAVLLHLRRAHPAWPAALGALGILAKESAIAVPLLLVASDLAAGGTARARDRRRAVAWSAGAVAAVVAVRFGVLAAAGADTGQGRGLGLGPLGVLASLPSMFSWYGLRILVPSAGTFDLQLEASLPLGLLFLAGMAILALAPRLGLRPAAVGAAAAWAFAALLPVTLLQIAFPLKILVADRFLYLALAGPALGLGALAASLGTGASRALLVASPLLLLATLPVATRWRSDETLWTDTLERMPGHARALHGLGRATENHPKTALSWYRRAVEAEPANAVAWFRRGAMEERLADRAADAKEARYLRTSAAASLAEAISLWMRGEREGRTLGLPEASAARSRVLRALEERR